MKLPETIEALGVAIEADIPAMLWSAPGIGKSDAVKALAARRGADCRDIRLSMFDPVDLRGLPAVVDGLTKWLRPAIWPTDENRETFLFFDEIDRAAPAVMSAAMQIVLDRRIGEHLLPACVRVVAAGNGKTDRHGTNRMPTALANRFAHFNVEPDAEAWAQWALGAGVPPELVAFLRFRPGLIHAATMEQERIPADPDGLRFPSPRNWARIAKLMGQPETVRHQLVKALVGEGPAAELAGFLATITKLPSLDTILRDPAGAMLPTEPGAMFAVATMLARRSTPDNFGSVMAYANRLPTEFRTVTAVDAARLNPAVRETHAYASWGAANGAVLS